MKDIKEYFKSLPINQQTDEVYNLIDEILMEASAEYQDALDSGYENGYSDGQESGYFEGLEEGRNEDK